jgi:hypothetical protein
MHELHAVGYDLRPELIDARADGKEHFQMTKARDIVRNVPGQEVPHLFRVERFAAMVEFQIRKLARKGLAEHCSPGGIGIEKKCHRCTPVVSMAVHSACAIHRTSGA